MLGNSCTVPYIRHTSATLKLQHHDQENRANRWNSRRARPDSTEERNISAGIPRQSSASTLVAILTALYVVMRIRHGQ
jgi:hypothetical protein